MYILAINGSPNKEGNTNFLLRRILDKIGDNAECELVYLQEALQDCPNTYCSACSSPCEGKCYQNTALNKVYEKMKRADFILFGSPVYFGSMTAQLKTLFDKSRKLRTEGAFIGKKGAAVTVGASKYGGQESTARSIQDCMLVHGMYISGDACEGFDAGHHGVCAQRPAQNDEFALKRCDILAQRILGL